MSGQDEAAAQPRERGALERHAQTVLATLIAAGIMAGYQKLDGLDDEVANLAGQVQAAQIAHQLATTASTAESARRDAALATLADTVARHDRELADLSARQAADERNAARAARSRPGDGEAP